MTSNIFQDIKDRVDLGDLVRFYGLEVDLGGFACCPFHNERHPSFKVYEDHYHCFGCGEHGDHIDFVQKLYGLSNIEAAKKYGACDTVIPATDTIVESINAKTIESIPVRDYYYQGQTPQSFNIKKLFNLITSLTEEESNILTDACKIFILKDEDVHLVDGEVTNIKITYPYDLKLANTILEDIHD